MKKENGITLISLVITIILIMILAAVGTYTGVQVFENMRVRAFVARMKTVQEAVDKLCDKYTVNEINSMGSGLPVEVEQLFNTITGEWGETKGSWYTDAGDDIATNYRYFSKDDIKNINSIISNLQFAYIQKKVNLQVIVNECDARILWIIDNMQKDIQSTYKTKEQSLTVIKAPRPSQKIFKRIKNVFTGKKKYSRFLEDFKTIGLQNVQKDVSEKITYLSYVLEGILKQTDQTKEKINSTDNKTKVA